MENYREEIIRTLENRKQVLSELIDITDAQIRKLITLHANTNQASSDGVDKIEYEN